MIVALISDIHYAEFIIHHAEFIIYYVGGSHHLVSNLTCTPHRSYQVEGLATSLIFAVFICAHLISPTEWII